MTSVVEAGLWSDRPFANQYEEYGDLYLTDEYLIDEDNVIQREGENNDSEYTSTRRQASTF
ncbi:hypothetical protein [Mycobacterium lepromatosis]|uniref:hypothetical protein n=1 Tax=Mycobacterium lepromatosis TaxID=480418 RepID=UPI0005F7766D|nr:hypothetical protein [Mycobacterium lepromatosis]UKN42642.1 hypothetical protein MLPF_2263 [Mycobacterium lepromatosis]